MRKRLWPVLFCAFLFHSGCADLADVPEQGKPVSSQGAPAQSSYGDFQKYESLHFIVSAGTYQKAAWVGGICEDVYRKIMFDTNLLSFKPRENYKIVVYRNQEEYQQKTGMPAWSGGGTSTQLIGQLLPEEREQKARTNIATFENVLSAPLLAHEVSHLVFNEFMNFATPEDSYSALWLNEGLATYEEMEARDKSERDEFVPMTRGFLKRYSMPLGEAVRWRPLREPARDLDKFFFQGASYKLTNVEVWYWQARDVTEFLIKKQGAYKFFVLLNALKQKRDLSQALAEAYPGSWRSLSELESEWRQSL